MVIYIYESYENTKYEKVKYSSEHIPRIGETLYFSHFGSFKVKDVIYHISDDSSANTVMWVEVYVEDL